MSKNMPASAMDNPFAQQQKILLYVFPVIFAVSGVNFPVGVLLYWLTTNLWTMGQQFYVIRRNPAPGSPAFDALEKRKAEKAARTKHEAATAAAADGGTATAVEDGQAATGTDGPQRPGQRQQPRRQPKRKR
jgi:YidC/Oxa1 family membrane protein insertase